MSKKMRMTDQEWSAWGAAREEEKKLAQEILALLDAPKRTGVVERFTHGRKLARVLLKLMSVFPQALSSREDAIEHFRECFEEALRATAVWQDVAAYVLGRSGDPIEVLNLVSELRNEIIRLRASGYTGELI